MLYYLTLLHIGYTKCFIHAACSCTSHTHIHTHRRYKASTVLQLASCHWVIKAKQEKWSNRSEAIQTLKHWVKRAARQERGVIVGKKYKKGKINFQCEHLPALEVIREARTNSVGDIQSSFPVVGWNLSSHVPVECQIIQQLFHFIVQFLYSKKMISVVISVGKKNLYFSRWNASR